MMVAGVGVAECGEGSVPEGMWREFVPKGMWQGNVPKNVARVRAGGNVARVCAGGNVARVCAEAQRHLVVEELSLGPQQLLSFVDLRPTPRLLA